MEKENFCNGCCPDCERFKEETPTLAESEVGVPTSPKENVGKERPKESRDEEKLDKMLKELDKKQKEEKEQYKRKKPRM